MQESYEAIYERLRELHALLKETIDGLPQEALDWSPGPGINSIAVLATHVAGAERYWIGEVIGEEPAGRDRDAEFAVGGVKSDALSRQLDDALSRTRRVLMSLSADDLPALRLSQRNQQEFSVAWILAHMVEHAALHLGHAQITRQLWDQQAQGS